MDEKTELFNFIGNGKLSVIGKDIKVDVDFSVVVKYNAEIELRFTSNNFFDSNFRLLKEAVDNKFAQCRFDGIAPGNKKILVPEFYISTFNFRATQGQSPQITIITNLFSEVFVWDSAFANHEELFNKKGTVKVGLLNFVFGGKYFTKFPDGSASRDFFNVKIGNSEIGFRQLREYTEIERVLKKEKNTMITSEMEFVNAEYSSTQKLAEDLFWLLSYSQKTLISKLYTKVIVDDKEALLVLCNVGKARKYHYVNSSFIDATHLRGDCIEQFFAETYDKFMEKKTSLKLDNIIDILCQAELSPILEVKYLLLSCALELSVDVVIQDEGIPIEKDAELIGEHCRAVKNYLDNKKLQLDEEHVSAIAEKFYRPTLKKEVEAVIGKFGFIYSGDEIKRIKDNRNKVVHEVKLADYDKPLEDYNLIRLLIDRVLIKTLGYSGEVLNYSNKYNFEKII
ncbi:MAG: hypothetical protein COV47_04485 [Candidatus Diapherotrites archaeon CG11_big_fil_rev_8_21_14_0_20_37_9]|nr:MAG: hypothetical protein COV47_04485 [Candidatus Diapherotrites archaeon CG11_big_fil_rev_8_21_14_0_20_37_9]